MILISSLAAAAIIREFQSQIETSVKVVEEMRREADKAFEEAGTGKDGKPRAELMDRLEKMESGVRGYYTGLIADMLASGWIDIRKKKPEPMTPCLMATRSLSFEGMMSADGKIVRNGSGDYEEILGESVVGWTPLPLPPETQPAV